MHAIRDSESDERALAENACLCVGDSEVCDWARAACSPG
jgi:hypothetical protein